MLTPRFVVEYHCGSSQRLLRRLGGGYRGAVKAVSYCFYFLLLFYSMVMGYCAGID